MTKLCFSSVKIDLLENSVQCVKICFQCLLVDMQLTGSFLFAVLVVFFVVMQVMFWRTDLATFNKSKRFVQFTGMKSS